MKFVISFRDVMTGKFEVEAETLDEAQKRAEAIAGSLQLFNYMKNSRCRLVYRVKKEKAAKNGNRKNRIG